MIMLSEAELYLNKNIYAKKQISKPFDIRTGIVRMSYPPNRYAVPSADGLFYSILYRLSNGELPKNPLSAAAAASGAFMFAFRAAGVIV